MWFLRSKIFNVCRTLWTPCTMWEKDANMYGSETLQKTQ